MGKSSKKAHKYRNRVGRHSKIINECNQAISSDARDICSDLTSSLDERRINACILLANIFMGDKTHTSVHDRIASDDILRKLSLRLVDHNATVRVHAAGAVRNIAASGNITSVTRLCDVGVMGSVVTLVTRELQVISDNNSLLVEQLLEAICNLSAANEEAAAVGVSRASGLIPALLALIDKGSSSFTLLPSATNTLLVLTDDCSEACQQLTDPVGMAAIMSCLSGGVLAASSLSPAQEARSRLNCAGVVLHMFSCGLLEASAAIVCQAVSVIGAFLDTDAQVVRWAEQSLAPLQVYSADSDTSVADAGFPGEGSMDGVTSTESGPRHQSGQRRTRSRTMSTTDEDVDGGAFEHRAMLDVQKLAIELMTNAAAAVKGSFHSGDLQSTVTDTVAMGDAQLEQAEAEMEALVSARADATEFSHQQVAPGAEALVTVVFDCLQSITHWMQSVTSLLQKPVLSPASSRLFVETADSLSAEEPDAVAIAVALLEILESAMAVCANVVDLSGMPSAGSTQSILQSAVATLLTSESQLLAALAGTNLSTKPSVPKAEISAAAATGMTCLAGLLACTSMLSSASSDSDGDIWSLDSQHRLFGLLSAALSLLSANKGQEYFRSNLASAVLGCVSALAAALQSLDLAAFVQESYAQTISEALLGLAEGVLSDVVAACAVADAFIDLHSSDDESLCQVFASVKAVSRLQVIAVALHRQLQLPAVTASLEADVLAQCREQLLNLRRFVKYKLKKRPSV